KFSPNTQISITLPHQPLNSHPGRDATNSDPGEEPSGDRSVAAVSTIESLRLENCRLRLASVAADLPSSSPSFVVSQSFFPTLPFVACCSSLTSSPSALP
ncbi:hypothetical protein S245_019366, partial [Arachis hypogaea]